MPAKSCLLFAIATFVYFAQAEAHADAIDGRWCHKGKQVIIEEGTILKLMSSNDTIREGIDWVFLVRELQRHFAPSATFEELRPLTEHVQQTTYTPGSVLLGKKQLLPSASRDDVSRQGHSGLPGVP